MDSVFVKVPIWKTRQHEQLFAMLAYSARLEPEARGLVVNLATEEHLITAHVREVIMLSGRVRESLVTEVE